jgi:uncharacterized protein (TIGR03437 family)
VGLRFSRSFLVFCWLISGSCLYGAPVLRLVSSTVGPVAVALNASAGTRTVEAYNAGDGSLSLSLTSSVSWISATTGAARNCTTTLQAGTCIPLQLSLNTASLPAGLRSGVVTVSDPNAFDAPQTIVVTVRVGGIDRFAAPGKIQDLYFTTSSMVRSTITGATRGSSWLSVALDGTGSFRFEFPYRVRLNPTEGMEGNYPASIVTSGGAATDNQTIPVTMRVTSQAIARAVPDTVNVRLAQGAPATAVGIAVENDGLESLTVQGATATGQGIAAAVAAGSVTVTLDAGTLAPGVYSGSVAIATNAANASLTVPVNFEVVAKGAPLIYYQGVLDNATFTPGDTVTQGDIMVVKGEQFSFGPLALGKAAPLDTEVGGAKVLVNGTPAPMYYSTYGQLAFQMPVNTPVGTARVQVQRDGQNSNTVTVEVAERAPRLLLIGTTPYGAIQNASDYSIPMPSGAIPGVLTHPAAPGDTLLIYAIGMGATSPAVATGDPAPAAAPFASLTKMPMVVFGAGIAGIPATPSFAGLAPGFAGLYQINVQIPATVPKGTVAVTVGFGDTASNTVQIVVQ